MSLEYRRYPGKGATRNHLNTCPLCGYAFAPVENRWKHFLDEHEPGDCVGVTPLGERNPDADQPLFPETEFEPEGSK